MVELELSLSFSNMGSSPFSLSMVAPFVLNGFSLVERGLSLVERGLYYRCFWLNGMVLCDGGSSQVRLVCLRRN